MKTTFDLPDDLVCAIKLRAVLEDRKLKDLMAELLRQGLSAPDRAAAARRVQVPLVRCVHSAAADEEMTPDRVAAVLLEEEAHGAGRE
ncbi:MAG: antitoxin [Dehalococcoidia bacterium]|nr:antitoxin [Dehalococcoidia bacterium]